MSVSSSVDISFYERGLYSATLIIDTLMKKGWTPEYDNMCMYLPLGDDDNFAWELILAARIDVGLDEIARKSAKKETVGIQLVWKETGTGSMFLVYPDYKLSVQLSINRRSLESVGKVTDVSWYLEKLLVPFKDSGLIVETLRWSEHQ